MKTLQGRTALVTGASGGLGTHLARRLAREGMNVAVSGRREDALAAVVAELEELGVKAVAVPADLSNLSATDALIDNGVRACRARGAEVWAPKFGITEMFRKIAVSRGRA